MRIAARCLIALAVVAALAGQAPAQPIQFFFADTAGNFTNSFNAPVGGFVDIDVYLNDTGAASSFFTNQPAQTNNLNTYHMLGIGLRVTSSAPAVATVTSTASVTPNVDTTLMPSGNQTIPKFNTLISLAAGGGFAALQESVLGGLGYNVGGTGRAYVGRFRYSALTTGSTQLTFSDNNPLFGATSLGTVNPPGTNGGTVFDPVGSSPIQNLFSNTATIFVAVPEPTSLTLCGLAAAGLGVYRRRKAKRA